MSLNGECRFSASRVGRGVARRRVPAKRRPQCVRAAEAPRGGSQFGSTPLHGAVSLGKLDVAQMLLKSGADKDVKNMVRVPRAAAQRCAMRRLQLPYAKMEGRSHARSRGASGVVSVCYVCGDTTRMRAGRPSR